MDVPMLHQRDAEVLLRQRTQQRGNVQTIQVRIRENTNLAVAELTQKSSLFRIPLAARNVIAPLEANCLSDETSRVLKLPFSVIA